MATLYLNTDMRVTVDGLQDSDDDSYVNDATITMTLNDENGTAVTGAENITLSYVSASNGKYRGTLPSSASVTVDTEYELVITASSSGRDREWQIPASVKKDPGN